MCNFITQNKKKLEDFQSSVNQFGPKRLNNKKYFVYLQQKAAVLQEFTDDARSWNICVKSFKGVKYASVALTIRSNSEGNC